MLIGPFAYDVALVNITFGEKILSVDDCNKRGFNVQERRSQRSGLKFILLKVPFADRVVQQMVSVPLNSENLEKIKNIHSNFLYQTEAGVTVYSLRLTFGLAVLHRFMPFYHTAHLEAKLAEVGE